MLYSVITVHGLRDDFKTAWTDKKGNRWVKDQLFENQSIREINFSYEIDEYATIYDPLCIMIDHGNNLLGQYAEVREKLKKVSFPVPVQPEHMILTAIVDRLKPTALLYGFATILGVRSLNRYIPLQCRQFITR